MNVFYTDPHPTISAIYLPDKLVIKMSLESAQILCTSLNMVHNVKTQYKPTHKNHPSVQWAARSYQNWIWLYFHGLALTKEYKERYKKSNHASEPVILGCKGMVDQISLKKIELWQVGKFTEPPKCMPEPYKSIPETTVAYQTYLQKEKAYFATWKRNKPSWWK